MLTIMRNKIKVWWKIGRVCFIRASNAITPNGANAAKINDKYMWAVRKKINDVVTNKVEIKNPLTLRDANIMLHNISIHNRGLFKNEVEMFIKTSSMAAADDGLEPP